MISDEIAVFLNTPAGRRALRSVTSDMSKQNRLAYKNNLIDPPENVRKLMNLKNEIERLYSVYKDGMADSKKSKEFI